MAQKYDDKNQPRKSPDQKQAEKDAHKDPLSGRAGAHPVATGAGAAAGGAILGAAAGGAAIGSAAGPVGTAVGAAAGAVAGAVGGGLAGKAIAEKIDPTVEHGYWRQSFASRPYVKPGLTYDDYATAYQFGWESKASHGHRAFHEVEADLRRDWDKIKGTSKLEWEHARHAARDAWNRISRHEEQREQI